MNLKWNEPKINRVELNRKTENKDKLKTKIS